MKIEIWSDFGCPFCYIGKRNLEKALENFAHRDEVSIEFKSYELNPDAAYNPEESFYETFSKLKGMPLDQVKAMNEQVRQQAAQVGLTYHFDTMKYANTFDAHRVAKYAEEQGKDTEMIERLLHAYFTESKLLSDHETLAELATEIGLEKEKVKEVLEQNKFAKEVQDDIDMAREIGVQGVPFFVFNRKYAVSGAQPTETFSQALEQIWQENQSS